MLVIDFPMSRREKKCGEKNSFHNFLLAFHSTLHLIPSLIGSNFMPSSVASGKLIPFNHTFHLLVTLSKKERERKVKKGGV